MYLGNDSVVCDTCGHDPAECICPECPQCHEVGNRFCYDAGYLTYTHEQLIGQAKLDIVKAKDQLADAEQYLQYLMEKGRDV